MVGDSLTQCIPNGDVKLNDQMDKAFTRFLTFYYYGAAIYFFSTAILNGYFVGFLTGLLTGFFFPLLLLPVCMFLGMGFVFAVFSLYEFDAVWLTLKNFWILASELNIWLATVWREDSQSVSEIWNLIKTRLEVMF